MKRKDDLRLDIDLDIRTIYPDSLDREGAFYTSHGYPNESVYISSGVVDPVYLKSVLELNKDCASELHEDICKRLRDIYVKKNQDYGNSFDESLDKFGLIASATRINDKVNRFFSLCTGKKKAKVVEESVKDTLMDLANYTIMTIMWLEEKENLAKNSKKGAKK